MKKTVFITGSSGFVGRNLIEFFQDRYKILAPTHQELDITNSANIEEYFNEHEIDFIIHGANVGGSRKTGYDVGSIDIVDKNLRMFFNLMRSQKSNTRFIHFGSGAEYDKNNYIPKMSEEFFDTYVPMDSYGFSKYIMSKYIEKTENVTCLRIFGLYGKYEDYSYKFISNSIVKNLLHLPIIINQNVRFSYLFIDDLMKIVADVISQQPSKRFINVTPTDSIELIEIANIINEVSDFQSEIIVNNSGLNREYTGANLRLLEEYADMEFTSYKTGIEKLYNYYKENFDSLDLDTVKEDPYLKSCSTKK
jgi:GDP-L-fucose synthase